MPIPVPGSTPSSLPVGYSRSPLIPVVVTLAMVTVLAVVAVFWWLYRTQGWKPMPSQPS